MLGTYCVTQHQLNLTGARHLLHFSFLAPKLCLAPTIFSTPEHFHSTHTRFYLFSALTKNPTQHELTFSAPTNEFSQAL